MKDTLKISDRFTVSRVPQNNDAGSFRNEVQLNVDNLNARRNSRTVPALPSDSDRRKFSLAQLTR